MMHVSLYRDILVSAVAYDPDAPDPSVHIEVHDRESLTPDRIAYLDITPKQARKLASELVAAANRCKKRVKGWDFVEGNNSDAAENV